MPLVDQTHDLAAMTRAITARTRLVFVACPNNPTGTANSEADLREAGADRVFPGLPALQAALASDVA